MTPWRNLNLFFFYSFIQIIYSLSAGVVSARTLSVYTPDWPPFYIQEANQGNSRGMAWDVLSTCSRRIDKTPVFDNYPIRRMIKKMEDGELDLNIMSFKEDRLRIMAYGKEIIFENDYIIITGGHVTKPIRRLSDLNDLSVAQLVGLRPSDEFKRWFDDRLKNKSGKETFLLNSEEQILKMLANGRVDATVASRAEVKWRSKRLGLTSRIRETNLLIRKQPYFFVMAKQSPIYKARPSSLSTLDACVRDLKRTGSWAKMKSRYQL
jgi:polar amino acid transport system substrate-binding protein